MNVYLTFDIEVWCNGWDSLDVSFPANFQRYVFGKSKHGEYALPKTLEHLNRHGLKGVFFVEPLFAARFGAKYLAIIVDLIREAGHEIQLHLHTEWTDEALEPLIENCATKRQHLTNYTLEEQTMLIAHGKRMLESAGANTLQAFRAGSFAANRDTFAALRRNGILLDSSLNRCHAISGPDIPQARVGRSAFTLEGVTTYPVTVIKDGFGRDRPAQVGACGYAEMSGALLDAHQLGMRDFVIVSHNFEMLRPGTTSPDWVVVQRFQRLCEFLARHTDKLTVRGFNDLPSTAKDEMTGTDAQPHAGIHATAWRHFEQLKRRLH